MLQVWGLWIGAEASQNYGPILILVIDYIPALNIGGEPTWDPDLGNYSFGFHCWLLRRRRDPSSSRLGLGCRVCGVGFRVSGVYV